MLMMHIFSLSWRAGGSYVTYEQYVGEPYLLHTANIDVVCKSRGFD